MKLSSKYSLTFITIIFLFLSIVAGIYLYLKPPRIIKNNHLNLSLDDGPAELIIDSNGYYHIYAQSDHDMYKTMGYLQAANHLEKMDLFLRTANGRLSEAFGKKYLEADILARTIGFSRIADKFVDQIDPEVYQVLSAYCEGINAFTDHNYHYLHRKFKLHRYRPLRWKPADCLAVHRLLAWLLSDELVKKTVFYKLIEIYGPDKVQEGFPVFTNLPKQVTENYNTLLFPVLNKIVRQHMQMTNLLHISNEEIESSWALGTGHSTENIPALGKELPDFLNEYHDLFELHSQDIHLGGLGIPGIPFVLFGYNGTIAWNLTIRPADNLEFVILPQNHSDQIVSIRETINVRNEPDTSISIMESAMGPVIGSGNLAQTGPVRIAISWGGYRFSDDFKCYTQLCTASNWEEFKKAVSFHVVPAAEVDYIDRNANIGTAQYVSNPEFPAGSKFLPTLSRLYDKDFTGPVHHLFRYLNPPNGIIRHYRSFSGFLPDSIITKDISATDSLSEFCHIPENNIDLYAKILLPLILDIISPEQFRNPLYTQAYNVLTTWDCNTCNLNPALTIYDSFINILVQAIYKDEMDLADSHLFNQFLHLTDEIHLNLYGLLTGEESSWFDDIRSNDIIEHRKMLVTRSFIQTVDTLSGRYSENISQWSPENCLPPERIEHTNFLLALESHPVIYQSSHQLVRSHFLNREKLLVDKAIRLSLFNRFQLIRDSARLISISSD